MVTAECRGDNAEPPLVPRRGGGGEPGGGGPGRKHTPLSYIVQGCLKYVYALRCFSLLHVNSCVSAPTEGDGGGQEVSGGGEGESGGGEEGCGGGEGQGLLLAPHPGRGADGSQGESTQLSLEDSPVF